MSDAKSWLLRSAEARGVLYGERLDAYDPAFIEQCLPRFEALFGAGRYFDVVAQGWENVPTDPAMIVSNHSGGTIVLDALGLGASWYQHFGGTRPLHGMVHEAVFATRTTGAFFERCGALRARRDLAERALVDFRRHLVVMPGGDRDVWRPASQRFDVCFGGRRGYAQTAARLRVPVVPVAHVGAHHTLHVLTDGHRFAERVGFVHAVARADIFPVHLSLPWGIAIGPWPHLPPPTRFDYRIAEPVEPPVRTTDIAVRAFDSEVQRRIQAELDILRETRPRTISLQTMRHRAREAVRSLRRFGETLATPLEPYAEVAAK